jgi:hypothetical protein
VTVEFSPWYPLADARHAAPAGPGVYQIKLPHVIDYPTGKSAMIHYGEAVDLRAALVGLGRRHPEPSWLARHEEVAAPADRAALLDQLLARFRQRFGLEPSLPSSSERP